jgi:stage V sporulation protein AC
MKFDSSSYQAIVSRRAARSPIFSNCLRAFFFGGFICAIGEGLSHLYRFLGADFELSLTLVSITLVFIAAMLTGFGIFDRIARHAGAGTLVPITGFANAIVSPAIDNKAEGLILGVGAKIFSISGPVILYALLFGGLYGIVYYLITLFL